MSKRTTSPATVNANIVATIVPPYTPLTNNPAYDGMVRDTAKHPHLQEAAARLLKQQQELGVTQSDLDLELSFYAANSDIGPEACDGVQAASFRQAMGYVVRCAAELDAWSNSEDEWANYHESNPAPETADAVLPVEQAASVVEQVQETAAQTEQDEAAAREEQVEESVQTLKECVKAYAKGERSYRTGLLESGRLCGQYIAQRLALGDKRSAAVQTIEGQLAMYSSDKVDAGRLTKAYHAYRLLCVECGLVDAAKKAPYGHYRDAWSRLVDIQNGNTPAESYVLLPGSEDACKALFATAVKTGLSLEAAKDKTTFLLQQHTVQQAKRAAEKAKALATEKAAKELAAGRARIETQKASTEVITQQEELAKATDDAAKAVVTANMEAAKQELLAKQQLERAATEAAAEAARVKAKADKDAAEAKALVEKQAAAAQKAADKQAEKDAKAAAKANGETPKATVVAANQGQKPEAPAGGNLLRHLKDISKAGVAKDVAEWAVELITGGDSPDDVFAALLDLLDGHKDLSKGTHRAIKAARASLGENNRRITVTLPAAGGTVESNGHAKPVAV